MIRFYSQNGEDVILDALFKDKGNGYFVEVGCIDGRRFSNTLTFEERGWNGLCIEAHEGYIDLLVRNRPNSIVYHCAVGEKDEEQVAFYANARGSLSTLDAGKEEYFKTRFGKWFTGFEQQTVRKKRLDSVFKECGVPEIDILSLDIEGYEIEALRGIDLACYQPRVLLVEADGPEDEQNLESLLSPYGYRRIGRLKNNVFFGRQDFRFPQSIYGWNGRKTVVTHTRHPLDAGADTDVEVKLDFAA